MEQRYTDRYLKSISFTTGFQRLSCLCKWEMFDRIVEFEIQPAFPVLFITQWPRQASTTVECHCELTSTRMVWTGSVPHRLTCLNIWSPANGPLLGGCGNFWAEERADREPQAMMWSGGLQPAWFWGSHSLSVLGDVSQACCQFWPPWMEPWPPRWPHHETVS